MNKFECNVSRHISLPIVVSLSPVKAVIRKNVAQIPSIFFIFEHHLVGLTRIHGMMASETSPSETSPERWSYAMQLSNPIHAVFAHKNFVFEIDYKLMKPALRLASRLLEVNEMLPFWHLLLLGQAKDIQPHNQPKTGRLVAIGNSYKGEFNSEEAQRVRKALNDLSDNVTFGRLWNGSKGQKGNTHTTKSRASGTFKGVKSNIRIALGQLEKAHNDMERN